MPKLRWTFLVAIVLGAAAVLVAAAVDRRAPSPRVDAKRLTPAVWISEQIGPEQLAALKSQGFRAVVDLRPDNEVAGQPPASAMSAAAAGQGLAFDYIPVGHGEVPSGAVDALGKALARGDQPVLLYCRSGRRAARTWALAEASRAGGLDAPAILNAVHQAGQDAGDLADQITARVAARSAAH
jgi:uncharacterized protein (TIGR01244 family)